MESKKYKIKHGGPRTRRQPIMPNESHLKNEEEHLPDTRRQRLVREIAMPTNNLFEQHILTETIEATHLTPEQLKWTAGFMNPVLPSFMMAYDGFITQPTLISERVEPINEPTRDS